MADLANHAAATAAGYLRVATDYGTSRSPRYYSRYEKPVVGADGESGHLFKVDAASDVSQAAADLAALAQLNVLRSDRAGKKSSQGGSHTIDRD
jgi:hypothetical protein